MKTELTAEEQAFVSLHTFYNNSGRKTFLAYRPQDEKMVESIIKKRPELKDKLLKITNKIY